MKLTILSTSDTHGYLLPTDYTSRTSQTNFGLSRAATVIKAEKAAAGAEPVLVIENGDFLQGSPLAYYAAKVSHDLTPLSAAYDQIPYQVGIVGNHEFNYGADYLRQAISQSHRHFLCANILDEQGRPAFGQPYEILTFGDLKVAVLGLTTQYIPHWEAPEKIQGLTFKSAVSTAQEYVPRLHELADLVVVAYHGGFERDLTTAKPTEALTGENEGSALLAEVPGIDALVTGHQHRELADLVGQVPITQPGAKGAFVGKITLDWEQATKKVTAATAALIATASAQPDPEIVAQLSPLNQAVEDWLDQPLGTTTGDLTIKDPMAVRMHPHPYIQFVQDVQRAATGAKISGTALFNNEGRGFGRTITFRSVLTNYIYPNTLAVERITGADLRTALEQSAGYFSLADTGQVTVSERFKDPKPQHYNYDMYAGIDYVIDVSRPEGHRITKLTYQGQPIRPEQQLDVVINQYRAVGGGNYAMFKAAKIIKENPADMTELIADYLRQHPQVNATTEDNFRVITTPGSAH
ncbi:bifunctional metallophosphatase/5'-nucleotidase [Lapidilactobacillus luobeiensis]|uniref:bifunctional metallophosphatase/5'-nucleotidase n=1 Tax=Lapidilactobacillus luobeiensis TaxID=2950371 RepID=UPI0021C2C045|nr:bifunctional UDP-sugar hydrolase/5'-nucleotidase [Lapidilactobacillus luobeiensis]